MMESILLIIFAAVFFPGIILRVKSRASGRKGPGLFQPMKDLRVLFLKGSVFSETTSFVFQIAPVLGLSAILSAMLLLPFGKCYPIISFQADFVLFAYLLAFGKFLSMLSALDTGSSFEGMGANREALYSMLAEPAFFILMGTFAMITGYTSFYQIFNTFLLHDGYYSIIFGLAGAYILFQLIMIETSRLPVDDPKTHLELTMIHEVIILDNSGFDKAVIHISTYLKMSMYGMLIFSMLVPPDFILEVQVLLYFVLQLFIAAMIGIGESFRARNKMKNNPKFIFVLSAVALLTLFFLLIVKYNVLAS